jgi:starvation-inducible DNA-binding protein
METQLAEKVEIGLSDKSRTSVIGLLQKVVADQHILYIKTRNFHWNLKGSRFHDLHEFFEEQYQDLEKQIDSTAERIRMLGGESPGSMSEFLDLGSLEEQPGGLTDGTSAISMLEADHDAMARNLRKFIGQADDEHGDAGTADFLTGLLRKHEKTGWMLRSYLTSAEHHG